MVEFTCYSCEFKYVDEISGCSDAHMCYDCLDQDEELINKENIK